MMLINKSLQLIENLNIHSINYKYNLEVISLEQYPIVNISINKDNKLLSTIQINLTNCKNTSKIFSLNNILDVYDTGIVIDYKNKKIYNYQGISRDLLDK